jgi:hypothetical protein
MPKTRVSCPNCRQPVLADLEQLFDVGVDPGAKQRLLSGAVNMIQCPNCGFQGSLATPIVYHDPDKELLLTFVPPELGLPRDEQERLIGSMINQVLNNLPQEKRKAYLLRPQATLTMQGLVERVLEADGITREMIQSQQQRLNLIQRLLSTPEETLKEVVQQEDQLIDGEFFGLLRRLAEASLVSGDQESAQKLAGLQEQLIPLTTFGKTMQEESQEIEAAIAQLRSAGEKLDRQKLLDFVINAPSETRQRAFVSLARPLMDYSFFQLLSERIDRARSDGRSRLVSLREQLLDMTREYDQQVETRSQAARQLVNSILQAEDIQQTMMQNLPSVDEFFVQELNRLQDEARKRGDLDQLGKLQKMIDVLQQASSSPPEMVMIEELLDIPDAQGQRRYLEEHRDEITPEFLNALTNIASQVDNSEDKELADRIRELNRAVLRFSMEQKFR